jgi:hypothetical protein
MRILNSTQVRNSLPKIGLSPRCSPYLQLSHFSRLLHTVAVLLFMLLWLSPAQQLPGFAQLTGLQKLEKGLIPLMSILFCIHA